MSDNKFGATASMLGYFYQVRYALYLTLKFINKGDFNEKKISVKLEGLDDIEVLQDKEIFQLLQTKHLTGKNPLVNSSKHFWKTIRIWSEHVFNVKIIPSEVTLIFVINSVPSKGTIIDKLLSENKDFDAILKEMDNFIRESKNNNPEIVKSYKAFNQLTDTQKRELLISIKILALQPDIERLLEEDITKLLSPYSWSHHLENFSKDLDAWWFQRVIEQIKSDDSLPISATEVHHKLQNLRDGYLKDNLPISYEGKDVELPSDIEGYKFVLQLRMLGHNRQIESAKQDYYKARLQRCEWQDKGRVSPEDITNYEGTLVKEGWKRKFDKVCDNFEFENDERIDNLTNEKKLQELGRKIYEETLDDFIPFKTVTARYIMNGSYHELADKKPEPKVYWHPKFLEFLKKKD